MPELTWEEPEWHDTVGSTNALVLADPRPGRVVVARHQSAGQGRRGRTWQAPPGTSLAVTTVVPAPAGPRLGWVPLLAGLAVAQALGEGPYAVDARLKWPNDVLAPESGRWRKLCGVLAQGPRRTPDGSVVVVGAGLNVWQERGQLPSDAATSWRLAQDGDGPTRVEAERWLGRYLARLSDHLAAPEAARAAYEQRCLTLGADVVLHLPGDRQRTGRAVGLAHDGALLVEHAEGVVAHHAGDVVHLRPGG